MDKDGIIDGCDFVDSDGDQVRDIDDVFAGFDDTVDTTDQDGIPDGCIHQMRMMKNQTMLISLLKHAEPSSEENSTVIIAGIGLFIAILLALMFIRR